MSSEELERLINQCKSNDVDLKIDALTKLQAEFESGIDIPDPEPLINILKSCLRISNQHLTTATLCAIPPLLSIISRSTHVAPSSSRPLSVSSSTSSAPSSSSTDLLILRQLLNAFLTSGGIMDRLGDSREKSREKAREALVILGGLVFRSSPSTIKSKDGKTNETPLMTFERFLREGGLASKVWRVREQAILTLVHIRRAHHLFPIRPYLPLLVDALEDTDGNVRECARQSVIELFTGPGVTDAARADLKKEMSKKGVRKTIVDSVLSKLLSGSRNGGASTPQSEGSENGEGGSKREYIPPSLLLQGRKPPVIGPTGGPSTQGISRTMSHGSVKDIVSRPASRANMVSPILPSPIDGASVVEAVYIASSRDLETEFAAMLKPFEGKETEHNWAARDRGIQRVRGMIKGDVPIRYQETFLACLKDGFIQASLKTLASLRTTVSANTCSLYSELAINLGPAIDPFCDTLYTHLLRMAGFTKKIIAQQSQASVTTLIMHTSAQPRTLLPLLWNTLQEKIVQARTFVIGHLKTYLEHHGNRSKAHIESSGGLEIIEKSIKKALVDANPAVKDITRAAFWIFDGVWHSRAAAIIETLDPLPRKQLESACPNPEALASSLPPATPNTKKSSVAAAIAASRAKAKAIATAPPSLRHQATSTSHASRAASPTAQRALSPGRSVLKTTTTTNSNGRSTPSPTTRPPVLQRSSLSPPGSPRSPRSRIISQTIPRTVSGPTIPGSHFRSTSDSTMSSTPPDFMARFSPSPLSQTSPSRNSVLRMAMQTALPASPPASDTSPPRHVIHRTPAAVPVPPRPFTRPSTVVPDMEESLLLATAVPIPEDSDSDMDESVNLMSFSTPYKVYPPVQSTPTKAPSFSPRSDDSRPTVSNALSTSSPGRASEPVVEDALRARAEQAESAAERLLELVEPEEENSQQSLIPPSLLLGSVTSTPKLKSTTPTNLRTSVVNVTPSTPVNRNAAIMRQAAQFKNSPANNGRDESLVDVLHDRRHETGWWLKRLTLLHRGIPSKTVDKAQLPQDLDTFIAALEQGDADVSVLQKLAHLCTDNPTDGASPLSAVLGLPSSPSPFTAETRPLPSLIADIWSKDKRFERLFNALLKYLEPLKDSEVLEYGLIVLWEILENQAPYLEGREADIFTMLFIIRFCNNVNVLEATNVIRDALCAKIEPVYGLTTLHGSLRVFQMEPSHPLGSDAIKSTTYAFGVIALGKFILRLPPEILEEELPRLKSTLIPALNDSSSLVIRESAAVAIIAAQIVLRDETHLFTLLDGLADEKKNLLTYLFDKHGARGLAIPSGNQSMEKLEKEMRRLDTRTNTPQKP